MKRTILYYPTISIPDGEWLRRALFYFDEVASIVPQVVYFSGETGDLHVPLSAELEYLRAEGVFRPVPPEKLFLDELGEGWEAAHRLGDEFRAIVMDPRFRKLTGKRLVRVHQGKLSATNMDFLAGEGLLKDIDPQEGEIGESWFLVEERTALLYMSMLAQELADLDMGVTIPGTDQPDYEALIYRAADPENAIPCVETHIQGVLPVPREDVQLKDILAFKRKREVELLRYRVEIDSLDKKLAGATERAEVKQALVQFDEGQRIALHDLVEALQDAKLATVWGSVKTLIKADTPKLWGAGAVALGLAAGIASLPITLAVAGAAGAGTVGVGSYLVDQRNKRRALERESAFTYLYHAQAEGIL